MLYISFVFMATLFQVFRRAKFPHLVGFSLVYIFFAFVTREGSWDYFGYREYFLCSIDSRCDVTGFEGSFAAISLVSNALFDEYGFEVVVLFYIAASIVIKLALFRKHSAWFGVSLFVYSCHGLFLGEMTQLRASLAIAITWLALSQYSAGKKFSATALIGLATIFHLSSLLALVVPLLARLDAKVLIKSLLFAVALGFLLGNNEWAEYPSIGLDRVDVYLAALGSEALTAHQLNFYAVVMFVTVLLVIRPNAPELELFDRLCINSILFGLCFYQLLHFIPIIPLRVLEFYSSLYPFVVGIAYKSHRNPLARMFIISVYILLFANAAIKNNTRIDMVFDWHSFPYENMTEIQREQLQEKSQSGIWFLQ